MSNKNPNSYEVSSITEILSVIVAFVNIFIWWQTDMSFLWMVVITLICWFFIYLTIEVPIEKSKKEKEMRALASAKSILNDLVDEFLPALARKRIQGVSVDEYGVVESSRWQKECQHFMDKVFLPRLTPQETAAIYKNNMSEIATEIIEKKAAAEAENIRAELDFDEQMSPILYEEYCSSLLSKAGWISQVTQASGDQGADIIAKRNGEILVVQCKKYSKPVGNSAVQEIIAAKAHYKASHAAVVTNAGYTRSAKQLALTTGVALLHHSDLNRLEKLMVISSTSA